MWSEFLGSGSLVRSFTKITRIKYSIQTLSMTISVQLTTVDSHSVAGAGAPRSTRHTLGSYYLVRGQVSPLVDAALKVV